MLEAELEDDDLEVKIVGKTKRWLKEEYSQSRRILASLGTFIRSSPTDRDEWDFGTLSGDQDDALATEWTEIFDKMGSHAVIGAFKMLASIVEQARAANEKKNRSFVVTHAVPAALAILLHDWRIWDKAKEWKLFPINCGLIPMAALLVFIDTWDDYKRKGQASPISIESLVITDSGAVVTIKWFRAEDYEKEKLKYAAFRKALRNRQIGMHIEVKVASS
ncbi:MAG: hypothetical protein IMZ53_03270 [Thermoplasmata archaeon]|nr:hypothetical protein [Thermoplasmata archaeon]